MPKNNAILNLNEIQQATQEFVNGWTCSLLASRKVVLFAGNPRADILVVARDLGKDEIEKGEPLIGRAGSLFRTDASRLGFKVLRDMLLTNTVPLWPLGNKAFPKEIRELFRPVLNSVVQTVDPKFILTLGNEAMSMFLPMETGITKVAGETYQVGDRTIMLCAHPSYIARGVSKQEKWQTFTIPLRKLLKLYVQNKYQFST